MKDDTKIILLTLLSIIIILYSVFPYYAAYNLRKALETGNSYEIDKAIDFESLRKSLKEQLTASMMKEMKKDVGAKKNPFDGLALLLAPKLIDYVIDAYVTPYGIAALINNKKIDPGIQSGPSNTSIPIDWDKIQYAFFTNPTTFLIEYDRVGLEFKLQDWGWKLTRIIIPDSLLE